MLKFDFVERGLEIPRRSPPHFAGSILESKGMGMVFQKKGKEMLKKGKIFENLVKNVQNLKIFRKRTGDCVR